MAGLRSSTRIISTFGRSAFSSVGQGSTKLSAKSVTEARCISELTVAAERNTGLEAMIGFRLGLDVPIDVVGELKRAGYRAGSLCYGCLLDLSAKGARWLAWPMRSTASQVVQPVRDVRPQRSRSRFVFCLPRHPPSTSLSMLGVLISPP